MKQKNRNKNNHKTMLFTKGERERRKRVEERTTNKQIYIKIMIPTVGDCVFEMKSLLAFRGTYIYICQHGGEYW